MDGWFEQLVVCGGGGGRSDWTKFSSGPSANQKFSLALSAPMSLGSQFSSATSAPLEPQHPRGGGGGLDPGLRERGNDTSKSTGRSGRQKATTQRNMRREERVTIQGPVKEQQPDGMSHRGAGPPPLSSKGALTTACRMWLPHPAPMPSPSSVPQEGDQPAVGRIMTEFQAQFDRHMQPACPSQLTAPVLHKVLQYPPLQPLVWGGKGIGSQGDGCAQFLAKSPEDQQRVMEIVTRDLGMACLTLTLGASHEIRKAVIPVAGYQCNLFPANVTGTGMFPIVSADGLCKPAILLLVEEAVCAGVEEVAVVIHPEDEEVYRRLFHDKPSVAKYNRLTATAQAYSQRILELGKKVLGRPDPPLHPSPSLQPKI